MTNSKKSAASLEKTWPSRLREVWVPYEWGLLAEARAALSGWDQPQPQQEVQPDQIRALGLVDGEPVRLPAAVVTDGEPIRRYEHDHPGAMLHVDVTKFGNIPDGGGHRFVSRQQSKLNATATAHRTGERGKRYRPLIGTAFVHTVIDDHSRVA